MSNDIKARGGTEIQIQLMQQFVDVPDWIKVNVVPDATGSPVACADLRTTVTWLHLGPDYIECRDAVIGRQCQDRFVFVSHWQQQRFEDVYRLGSEVCYVIPNGIQPRPARPKPRDRINLVYMSTPDRGLDLLLNTWSTGVLDRCQLHVFSSFETHGRPGRDLQYQAMFDRCRNDPGITYHGSVPHDHMLDALQDMHVMAYPCCVPETFCLSMLESLAAGLRVVSSNIGAIPELCAGHAYLYAHGHDRTGNRRRFGDLLQKSIEEFWHHDMAPQIEFFNRRYDWAYISTLWRCMFDDLRPLPTHMYR